MKSNSYQRILLAVYGLLFIFFTVIHVPYGRYSDVYYDTIFEGNAEIIYGRIGLVLFIISILTAIGYWQVANLQPKPITIKLPRFRIDRKRLVSFLILTVALLVIGVGVYVAIQNDKAKKEAEKQRQREIETRKQNELFQKVAAEQRRKERIEIINYCTESAVEKNLKGYLAFQYANYRIVGKPIIVKTGECTFNVSFTAIDARYETLGKDYYVMSVSFNTFDHRYYFEQTRGKLF